jgi:hypothetical protein
MGLGSDSTWTLSKLQLCFSLSLYIDDDLYDFPTFFLLEATDWNMEMEMEMEWNVAAWLLLCN